jgi:hypothetical protein
MVRGYLDSLAQAGRQGEKRFFVKERITFNEETGNREFWMDPPAVLREKATTARVLRADWERPRHPYINGEDLHSVCESMFRFILSISGDYYQQRSQGPSKIMLENPVRKEVINTAPKTQSVLNWINAQVKISCIMPDSEMVVLSYNNKCAAHATYVIENEEALGVHWAQEAKQDVYRRMGELDEEMNRFELAAAAGVRQEDGTLPNGKGRYGNFLLGETDSLPEDPAIACLSWFNSTWAKPENLVSHIKIRKWMPFAKCDTCVKYREDFQRSRCVIEKSNLSAKHRKHIAFVKRERGTYAKHSCEAQLNPESFLSIIIDGADAARYSLPYFRSASHLSDAAWKLKVHILGAIAHGRDTYAFLLPSHIAQGNNVTCEVLRRVIDDVRKQEGKLPPILKLQLDNTAKQNKSRFLIGFCQHLVDAGVFKYIELNFLPVGHTHEDIDQFFSRLSVYMRSHNAMSRKQFKQHIERCCRKYGKYPKVENLDSVTNFSGYFVDELNIPPIPNISLYHQFRVFRRNDFGEVVVQVRTWPGTPKGDKVDFWRGPADNSAHHVVFPGPQPDFLRDYDKIPGAARATHVTKDPNVYKAGQAKKKKDIAGIISQFPASFLAEDIQDLEEHLELENIPVETKIPTTWTKSEIRAFYSWKDNGDRAEFVDSDLEEEANVVLHAPDVGVVQCDLFAQSFYITPPRTEESPFCLCKIKKVLQKDGVDGAYVQWWEISTEPEDRDYVEDPWHMNAIDARRHRILDHDWLPRTDFQEQVKMVAMTNYNTFKKKLLVEDGSTDKRPGHGVARRLIARKCRSKVRATVLRYQSEWGCGGNGDHGDVESRFL